MKKIKNLNQSHVKRGHHFQQSKAKQFQSRIIAILLVLPLLGGCGSNSDTSAPPTPSVQVISFGLSPDQPALRSSKDKWESSGITSLTVHAGDQIEVRPVKLIYQERATPGPVTTRTSEKVCTRSVQVCTASVPIFAPQCTRKCKLCESCNLFGCHYETCCSESCASVHTGDRCTNMETRCAAEEIHWQDVSLYSGLGDSTPKEDREPMKSVAQITAGIKIRLDSLDFSANSSTQPIECALNQFSLTVGAESVSFTLENVSGCPGLFQDGNSGAGKALTLLNHMSVSTTYLEGRLIKSQDGHVLEQPKTQNYEIPVDFVGSVSISPARIQ